MKPIATYAMSLGCSIEVHNVQHGAQDKVVWKWSNEKRVRKSILKYVGGKLCFRVNRMWMPIDDFMGV